MTWLEAVLLASVCLGIVAGVALIMQRPSFWFGLGMVAYRAALPELIRIATRRMSPKDEQAWRDCQRRSGRWNHIKRRCE